jgi:hypothetical protein
MEGKAIVCIYPSQSSEGRVVSLPVPAGNYGQSENTIQLEYDSQILYTLN